MAKGRGTRGIKQGDGEKDEEGGESWGSKEKRNLPYMSGVSRMAGVFGR